MNVQGVFKNKKYYLTDPNCQSLDQKFVSTDLKLLLYYLLKIFDYNKYSYKKFIFENF